MLDVHIDLCTAVEIFAVIGIGIAGFSAVVCP